jgi:hypothetical protein
VVALGSGSSLSANVPEPGTIAFVGLALPIVLFGGRRRAG